MPAPRHQARRADPMSSAHASSGLYARGPCHSHVNPMTCTRALSPARGPDEMCVGSPAQVHVEGPACASGDSRACSKVRMRAARHDRHHCAQNVDHLAHNSPFSAYFDEVVCTLGTTPPHVGSSPPPNGGIALHEGPTRRRHTLGRLRVVQNPHRHRYGGRRTGRKAGLRGARAAAPVGGDDTTPQAKCRT